MGPGTTRAWGASPKRRAPPRPRSLPQGRRPSSSIRRPSREARCITSTRSSAPRRRWRSPRFDFSAEHVGLGHPLDATISAAVVNPEKNFQARVHASKLPERFASLGPGEYPELQGDLALAGLDLGLVRAFLPPAVTNTMTGGKVDASAKLATRDGKYAVDGAGKLSQVRLRGEPAQGSFELHALVDPASGAGTATLEKLAVKGPRHGPRRPHLRRPEAAAGALRHRRAAARPRAGDGPPSPRRRRRRTKGRSSRRRSASRWARPTCRAPSTSTRW